MYFAHSKHTIYMQQCLKAFNKILFFFFVFTQIAHCLSLANNKNLFMLETKLIEIEIHCQVYNNFTN